MRAVFIGGCPRSGTTMLGALLGAHSRAVCVPESPFKIEPLLTDVFARGAAARASAGAAIAHDGYFRAWGIPAVAAGDGDPAAQVPYERWMSELVARYGAAVDRVEADVWIDHTPDNIRHARTLLAHFPEARVIHLVRDGRAVAASLLPLRWSVDTIFSAAGVWAEHLGHGLAAEGAHARRVRRVRYEDVLHDPVGVVGALCEWLALDREPQMGRESRFKVPRATADQHALVGRPPDPSRAHAWRSSLSRREVELFESLAGDLLADLGYALEFGGHPRPPDASERARAQLTDATGMLRRLGWRAAEKVRHRLGLGDPGAF